MKDNQKKGYCGRCRMGRGRHQGVGLHPQQALPPPPEGGALRAERVLEEEPRNQEDSGLTKIAYNWTPG